MNTIKKYFLRYKNQIFVSLIIAACAFGVYLANIVEDRHNTLVNGILSLSVLYLMYIAFLSPKRIVDAPNELRFESLKSLKYLIFGFFWTMILFWASGYILNLIVYLLSRFINQ